MVAYPATTIPMLATYLTTTAGGNMVQTNPKPITPYGGTWVNTSDPSVNHYSWNWVGGTGPISVTDNPAYTANNWTYTIGVYANARSPDPTYMIQIVYDGYVPEQGAYR